MLLDLDMPELTGTAAIPKLIDASPTTKIIVVTSEPASRAEATVRELGATAYLEKTGAQMVDRFPAVVRTAHTG